ncbi:cell division topological specificity factor MinE [cyanobiont of Ornithocercus magnificus]|nr:cell division topological specificity factor MinE [cyanobiont of Ornithocercus magnificus]
MVLRTLLDNMLRRQPASAARARERLQIVLAYDRSNLDPELLNQIRREIFEVVARYIEVNPDEGDVSLETEDNVTVLVANLPIRRMVPAISAAQIHN